MRLAVALLAALPVALLAGCAFTPDTHVAPSAGVAISGTVHGGQQPLVGSRIYLLAAGTGGYGTSSTSLLTSGISGGDSIGNYVLSGAGGSFSVTGDYLCLPGQQIYLLALGGDPTGAPLGTINNSGIGLMAALGSCPGAGTFAIKYPVVAINEVTTVAAAYSLAGFASDASHISSSGSAQATTGVANAFLTALNIANPVTGAAYVRPPTGNGGGVVPRAEIDSLANIIAACVNTPAAASTPCINLFNLARAAGATGTPPSDTATAMINIAHHPGVNITSLFNLIAGTGAPFQPSLTAAPNDFSLQIIWPAPSAGAIAFDSQGNLWVTGGALLEYSNTGALLSPAAGYTGGGLTATNTPNYLAIDPADNVWVTSYNSTTNSGNNYLSKFSNAGVPLSPSSGFTGGGLNLPSTLAIDGSASVWAGNSAGGAVAKFSNTGVAVQGSPFTLSGFTAIGSLALDNAGNLWAESFPTQSTQQMPSSALTELTNAGAFLRGATVPSSTVYSNLSVDAANDLFGTAYFYPYNNTNAIFELNSTGTPINGSPFAGNTAINQCLQTQVDGAGNVWCASDDNSIAEISGSGVPISPDAGYLFPTIYGPQYIAIDNSGNVWTNGDYTISNNGAFSSLMVELVGGAAPVITPLSLAIQQGKLGTRP